MKVGDLVKWIGYPGASSPPELNYGLIVSIKKTRNDFRLNVMWGGGTIGKMLYPETIEVVREAR